MYRFLTSVAFISSIVWLAKDPGFEPAITCLIALAAVFRDEFHGVVGVHLLSLSPRTAPVRNLTHLRYSFSRPAFINPMIIADLYGWISDLGDQVVSVNVSGANESNRYFAEVIVTDGEEHAVVSARHNQSSFAYQYLGCSFSGLHLLQIWSSGGGSGVFCAVMLVTLSTESAVEIEQDGVKKIERFIIKRVATIPLGDRYEGKLSFRFGMLTIGECPGRASLRSLKQRLVII